MTTPAGTPTEICATPVVSTVCNTIAGSTADAATAVFTAMAHVAGQTAKTAFQLVWSVFDDTTVIDLTRPGFIAIYNLLFGIAVTLMLLLFLIQVATATIRHDPPALGRAVTGLGTPVIGGFLVIALTGLLLTVVDGLCVGIVHATGTTMNALGARIAALGLTLTAITAGSPGVAAILTILLAGLAITATVSLWVSLLIRKSLLMVTIVLAPIALAGGVWDATRSWTTKWVQLVIALSVSKLVVVVVFLIAAIELDAPLAPNLKSVSDPLTGIVLMFVAAFAPYMAYRFISFIDLHPALAHEQDARQALHRPAPLPARLAPTAARAVLNRGAPARAAAGTAGTGAAAAVPVAGAVIAGAAATNAAGTAGAAVGTAAGRAADTTHRAAARDTTPPNRTDGSNR